MENFTPPTQAELDEWRKLFYEDVNWKCRVEAGAIFMRLIAEVERLRTAAGFCEKHQPTGGHRNCLVCGCEKLSFALDKISYALGEKNEMGISDYSLSYNEDKVVEKVARLTKEVEELRKDKKRLDWLDRHSWLDNLKVVAQVGKNPRTAIDSAMQQKGEE